LKVIGLIIYMYIYIESTIKHTLVLRDLWLALTSILAWCGFMPKRTSLGSARRPAVSDRSNEPADWSVARHANGAICSDNHNTAVFFKTVHFSNVFLLVSTVRKCRRRRSICECVIIASNFVDWYKQKQLV